MATTAKKSPPTKPPEVTPPKPDVEDLRADVIDILEDYLSALHEAAEKNPGEHNVTPIRIAKEALRLFRPGPPNQYS